MSRLVRWGSGTRRYGDYSYDPGSVASAGGGGGSVGGSSAGNAAQGAAQGYAARGAGGWGPTDVPSLDTTPNASASATTTSSSTGNLWNRTPKCGGRGQLGTSSSTLYTAPSGTSGAGIAQRALLRSIVLCNTDSASRTATIYLVESGGSAAANRAIVSGLTIAASTTTTLFFGDDCPLDFGETVRGLASSANLVTYRINVEELT